MRYNAKTITFIKETFKTDLIILEKYHMNFFRCTKNTKYDFSCGFHYNIILISINTDSHINNRFANPNISLDDLHSNVMSKYVMQLIIFLCFIFDDGLHQYLYYTTRYYTLYYNVELVILIKETIHFKKSSNLSRFKS